jgi:hypothetical protein
LTNTSRISSESANGHLDAGRSAAHHHEGEQGAPLGGIGLEHRPLEAPQHLIADTHGVRDVFQREAMLRHLVEPEIVGLGTHREDQIVVGNRSVGRAERPLGQVHTVHHAHAKIEPGLAPQDGPHRLGDFFRLEAGRGDLIQQRLEQVVVVAIDEDHVYRHATQRPGRLQPAESGAHDHHGWHYSRTTAVP